MDKVARIEYNSFTADKWIDFPERVKKITLYDSDGKCLDSKESFGETMKLKVCSASNNGFKKTGFIGYFTGRNEPAVVLKASEYLEVVY